MKSIVLVLASLTLSSTVLASDCRNRKNFPATLKVGNTFKINPQKDSGSAVKVSGSIEIISPCSFQFIDFSLANAKLSDEIRVYGVATRNQFPISPDVLSGKFSHESGPVIEFYDNSEFFVNSKVGGVAFEDFAFIRIYSVKTKTVIAEINLPEFNRATSPDFNTSPPSDASMDSVRARIEKALGAKSNKDEDEEEVVLPEAPLLNEVTKTLPPTAEKVVASPTTESATTSPKSGGKMNARSLIALFAAVALAVYGL